MKLCTMKQQKLYQKNKLYKIELSYLIKQLRKLVNTIKSLWEMLLIQWWLLIIITCKNKCITAVMWEREWCLWEIFDIISVRLQWYNLWKMMIGEHVGTKITMVLWCLQFNYCSFQSKVKLLFCWHWH